MFLSYRNQSIDLLCKSLECFLYDRDLVHERVKEGIYFIYALEQTVIEAWISDTKI